MNVIFIQRVLPHYRVPFFYLLRDDLGKVGVNLELVYGQENTGSVPRTVPLCEPWAKKIKNKYISVGDYETVWQPCLSHLKDADLIIVEQANRLLVNYLLLYFGRSKRKVAFWGHGRNMKLSENASFTEKIKKIFINKVDWWFAYTDASGRVVGDAGFPLDRITVVDNTVDNREFGDRLSEVTDSQKNALIQKLGIQGRNVCLFCGGMYQEKRLKFLLKACDAIKQIIPDFEILFVGTGPDKKHIEVAAQKNQWIHYLGPLYGIEKAVSFSISKALLMPGVVGLVVVDSFVSGVPLFTTDITGHGPEIEYLVNNVNGVIVENNIRSYADAVAEILNSGSGLRHLVEGCSMSSKEYTIENMTSKYSSGIQCCLGLTGD